METFLILDPSEMQLAEALDIKTCVKQNKTKNGMTCLITGTSHAGDRDHL